MLYIGALAAPNTIDAMPEETLFAFDAHGLVEQTLPRDGGDGDETVAAYGKAGSDVPALASKLQIEGANSFDDSWEDSMTSIGTKTKAFV